MSITFDGIEWDYNNLEGISYDSETLLEPYGRWFYLITSALNEEKELLGLSDSEHFEGANNAKEYIIKIKDYGRRQVVYSVGESFTISDSYKINSVRKSSESIDITDTSLRDFNKKTNDDIIYLLDESRYIKDDAGVISTVDQVELSGSIPLFDFELNNRVWSEKEFNTWCSDNSPVNYNPIRPFIPGEYEYMNAYVGFKLEIPTFDGQYGVANSTVYVDVEDTVEKGTSEATVGSLKRVQFSKRFYTSPHIMTSLNYSTENCYIEVPTVTKEYFEFGLKSIDNGQYLSGEINWLADGY